MEFSIKSGSPEKQRSACVVVGVFESRKLTLPADNPLVGHRVDTLALPENTALVTVLRGADVILPQPDHVLEAGDEMLFIADSSLQRTIRAAIHGAELIRAPIAARGDAD